MKTTVLKSSQSVDRAALCAEAAALLRAGEPVVFPTETVYGVGASAASREAVECLHQVKGRPEGKPFTVHIADPDDADCYVDTMSRISRRLAQKAWPGPLTLILDVAPTFEPHRWRERSGGAEPPIPELVFHDGAVGLRCPAHDLARDILRQAGVPVVASSANRAGNPPPFDARQAYHELQGRVGLVVDGGPTRFDSGSTIVRVRGESWTVVREGVLSERYLRKLVTMTMLFVCTGNTCRSPLAHALAKREVAARLGCEVDDLEPRHAVTIVSAGVFAPPGRPASDEVRHEAQQRGASLAEHRTRPLSVETIRQADVVFCMSRSHCEAVIALVPEAREKTMLLDPEDQEIADPMGGGLEDYAVAADHIERAVRKRIEERFA